MLRLILVFLVIVLVVRLFVNIGREVPYESSNRDRRPSEKPSKKGVPREMGEYVEYEEVNKKR